MRINIMEKIIHYLWEIPLETSVVLKNILCYYTPRRRFSTLLSYSSLNTPHSNWTEFIIHIKGLKGIWFFYLNWLWKSLLWNKIFFTILIKKNTFFQTLHTCSRTFSRTTHLSRQKRAMRGFFVWAIVKSAP